MGNWALEEDTQIERCLKITEKVSFNIASEVSYVYFLSWQKLIKNTKNGPFGEFLKTWSLRSNSVTRQVLIGQKLVENAKIQKFKCDILSNFQTMFLAKWKFKSDIFADFESPFYHQDSGE